MLQNKEMTWDTSRTFPPVRACLFSHNLTGVTFLGDPSAGTGLPRGTLVYANMPIPYQVSVFTSLLGHLTAYARQKTDDWQNWIFLAPYA